MASKLRERLRRASIGLSRKIAPRLMWKHAAQKGELEFHAADRWRPSDAFHESNARLLTEFGFRPDDFDGRVLIDLGAGSKLRTRYFEGAKIVAIEPLADRFRQTIEWCDLDDAWKCFSQPAEEFIDELRESADFVISINVLDHCFDFDVIVKHIFGYLKPGGHAFLSFDSHRVTDHMHPLRLTEKICRSKFEGTGFTIERVSRGLGSAGPTYGHGEALNFWLRRP